MGLQMYGLLLSERSAVRICMGTLRKQQTPRGVCCFCAFIVQFRTVLPVRGSGMPRRARMMAMRM